MAINMEELGATKSKVCNFCKVDIESSGFFIVRSRSKYTGEWLYHYSSYCKPCTRIKDAARRPAKKDKRIAPSGHKYCASCNLCLENESFALDPKGRRKSYCNECIKQRQRDYYASVSSTAEGRELLRLKRYEWYLANKDKAHSAVMAWQKRNPEENKAGRAAAKSRRRSVCGDNISAVDFSEALDAYRVGDKYLDAYSGNLIDKPTIDHIDPLAAGGHNHYVNLCVTDRATNTSKSDDMLIVWMAKKAKEAEWVLKRSAA